MAAWKSYRSGADYSYTLGAFPSFELMQQRPEQVLALLMHPSFAAQEAAARVEQFAAEHRLPLQVEAKAIQRLSPKENCYLIAIFAKYEDELQGTQKHLLLDRPANAGNLGTIMRTMRGFGFNDLAVLPPAVDLFDPRVVRASMGALFGLRCQRFEEWAAYRQRFADRALYPFMLNGRYPLQEAPAPQGPYTLIFGNEASGLGDAFAGVGHSLVIPQEPVVDSLNLTIAVGIACHHFYDRFGRASRGDTLG